MTKKRKGAIIALSLITLLWTGFIFFNSAQVGEDSAAASKGVVKLLYGLVEWTGITENGFHIFIRKAAHFSEYFILGAVTSLLVKAIKDKKQLLTLPVIFSFTVALTDEFLIQASTDGRAPLFTDVLIDTAGALTAVAFIIIFYGIRKKRYERKK